MDQTTHEAIEELRRGQRRNRRAWMAALVVVVLAWAMPAFSMTTVPYVFSPGTPARASEINADFAALASAIDGLDAANDTRLDALEAHRDYVPAGTIAFFGTSSCPSGWSEYAAANGRYVVAVTDGTEARTVGTALGDEEDRPHTHTIAHRHQWARFNSASYAWYAFTSTTAATDASIYDYDSSDGMSGGGHRYPLYGGGVTRTLYTGDPSTAESGSASASEIAPYIQLRACQKDPPTP